MPSTDIETERQEDIESTDRGAKRHTDSQREEKQRDRARGRGITPVLLII